MRQPDQKPVAAAAAPIQDAWAVVASAIVNWPEHWIRKVGLLLLAASCVPNDPAKETRPEPAPVSMSTATLQRWRPHAVAQARSSASTEPAPSALPEDHSGTEDIALTSPFHDSFDRNSLGSDWISTSENWRIESGQLCGQSNRNHPIWLKRRIPPKARISFLARARSAVGDLKVEAWGNGRGFAKAASYNDATGYIFIFGGWKNQLHVLARLNEHDDKRLELRIDRTSEDRKLLPVLPNVDYRFVIERTDGRTIVWRVNDLELFNFEDKQPLRGSQHDHFGFNNWEAPVCFDDLLITPLPE
jgi:hypothetical protein